MTDDPANPDPDPDPDPDDLSAFTRPPRRPRASAPVTFHRRARYPLIMQTPPPAKVIDVQATPNPNARKFVLDRPVSDATQSFLSPAMAGGHPMAASLFAVEGVASVMLLNDFVTINKKPDASWPAVIKSVRLVLEG